MQSYLVQDRIDWQILSTYLFAWTLQLEEISISIWGTVSHGCPEGLDRKNVLEAVSLDSPEHHGQLDFQITVAPRHARSCPSSLHRRRCKLYHSIHGRNVAALIRDER